MKSYGFLRAGLAVIVSQKKLQIYVAVPRKNEIQRVAPQKFRKRMDVLPRSPWNMDTSQVPFKSSSEAPARQVMFVACQVFLPE